MGSGLRDEADRGKRKRGRKKGATVYKRPARPFMILVYDGGDRWVCLQAYQSTEHKRLIAEYSKWDCAERSEALYYAERVLAKIRQALLRGEDTDGSA